MIIALILMYILTANNVAVPAGCFTAAWIVLGFEILIYIIEIFVIVKRR